MAAPTSDDSVSEFDAVLVDGRLVHLRPPVAADRPALAALHSRLSRRSAYLRFFSLSQRAPQRYLDLILAPDDHDLPGLVALIADSPVGVASYERLGGGDEAEVAFLVDDDHQGLGISTLLLEALAADARRRGINRFVAEVLPENEAMLDVFSAAGFSASPRRFREGTIRVSFELTTTEALLNAVGERERRADARSMARLLAPNSIAVLGATSRDDIGGRILANLRRGGYAGPIHDRRGAETADWSRGIPPVDLAILTVPADQVLEAAAGCAAAGVGNVLVTSGRLADAGDADRRREVELLTTARRAGMRLVGPQSLGVINTAAEVRLCATPTSCPQPGTVGVMSHSPALGVAMLGEMSRLGIGVSTFVSGGHTADVSGNDLLMFWEQDEATAVVVLYLERFGNPRKFALITRRLSRTKPVIVVAAGRRGRADSRSGAGGADYPAAVDALFRQAGVIRLERVEELFPVLELLLSEPLPAGHRVAVVSNSAAAGGLAADAAVSAGLLVPELAAATRQRLAAVLPPAAAVSNPIDLLEPADANTYAAVLPDLLAAEEVDAVLLSHARYPGAQRADVAVVARAAAGSAKPVVASLLGGPRPARLRDSRVPTFRFPETATRALARVADYAQWRESPTGQLPKLAGIDSAAATDVVRKLLTATPVGAVVSRSAAERLLGYYGIAVHAPEAVGDAPAGPAWTVGVTQDPLFGPLVSFGGAGVATELFGDVAHHILPLTDADAARLVRSLRSSPLLFGYRSRPPLAADALTDLLLRVGQLAEHHREVARLELDPVLVTPSDVLVGDVRLQVAPPVRAPSAWLRRLR